MSVTAVEGGPQIRFCSGPVKGSGRFWLSPVKPLSISCIVFHLIFSGPLRIERLSVSFNITVQYVRTRDYVSDTVTCSTVAHRDPSWALSCSPCTPQTSTNNHLTAIDRSALMTLLSSASSGTTENSSRTLWTGASRTTCSSTPGRQKSCWWTTCTQVNIQGTLRWWHLTSTWSSPEQ